MKFSKIELDTLIYLVDEEIPIYKKLESKHPIMYSSLNSLTKKLHEEAK